MNKKQLDLLKENVQSVINLLAEQRYDAALAQHRHSCEILDEILDYSKDDNDLIDISRYQVLLNQLQLKINNAVN